MEIDSAFIQVVAIFAFVGFVAQLVDGALGMAYGVVSTTVLLAFGVPPATASASVHAAEVFTTGTSSISHITHKNVEWRAFWFLAPAGIIGGVLGAYVLTGIDGAVTRPFIVAYLAVMGAYILTRAFKVWPSKPISGPVTVPLGLVGGFLDAIGGGGWGPTVSSSLIGAGGAPRYVIGTVNTAEFFVTVAISAAFVVALVTGHWENAGALMDHAGAVIGLVIGGVLAAPLAGYIVKAAPARTLTFAVGVLILLLAAFQGWKLL